MAPFFLSYFETNTLYISGKMLEESLSLLANDPDECPRDKNVEQQRQGVGPDEGDLSTRKGSKLKNSFL